MYRIVRIAIAALASVGMLASVAACGSGRSSSEKNGTIEVVASVNQWGTVAKTLGGDNVNVTSIINSTNVDAHDYEPTTSDIAKLQKAQVIIVNGAGYDAWAVKAAQSANATIVNAAAVGGVNDGENPHVWFSADVRKAVAQAITEAYEQADAAKKSDFDKLHDQWKSEENNVESKIAEVKQKSDGLAYAATESVASYLAEDMGLTDATPSGYARATANESEPTPTDIRQFADALKSGEIKLLIVNTQEESELTGKITNAAKSANVPMVELTEQMPERYDSLTAWMESLESHRIRRFTKKQYENKRYNNRGDSAVRAESPLFHLPNLNLFTEPVISAGGQVEPDVQNYRIAVMMKSRMNSSDTTQITGCTSLALPLQVLIRQ